MGHTLVNSREIKSYQNIILILALLFSIKTLLVSYDYMDVLITRTLQTIFEEKVYWAEILNVSIRFPFVLGVLVITGLLAIKRWGIQVGLTQITLSYLLAHLLNLALKTYVYVHKPDLDLVDVAAYSSASGWPATFVLIYGALWGGFLFDQNEFEKKAMTLFNKTRVLAAVVLVLSICASILLGGHWPTQILASLFMGIFISGFVFDIIRFSHEENSVEELGLNERKL